MIQNLLSEINDIYNETHDLVLKMKESIVCLFPFNEHTVSLQNKIQNELGVQISFLCADDEVQRENIKTHLIGEFIKTQDLKNTYFIITTTDDWIRDFWNLEWLGIPPQNIITPDQLKFCLSLKNDNMIEDILSTRNISDDDTPLEKHLKHISNTIINNIDKCEEVYCMLSDDESKKVFLRLLANRLTRSEFYDRIYSPGQYFTQTFICDLGFETYMDVGAYDGDSILNFVKCCPSYNRIYAFEPNVESFIQLAQNVSELNNIAIMNVGLYNQTGEQFFRNAHYGSSHVNGVFSWDTNLDDCVKQLFLRGDDIEAKPTFIKMDIEGSEVKALEGLQQTIATYHPKLSICAYHLTSDIWEIPLIIRRINNDYKLYLRHHSYGPTETVCYAI